MRSATRLWLGLWVLSACGEHPEPPAPATPSVSAPTSAAAPATTPAASLAATPAPPSTAPGSVRAAGLPIHRALAAPGEVLAVSAEDRPRSIAPAFTAAAGDPPGPRVFWVAYVSNPFTEARARAAEEGRVEAFERDVDTRMEACEAASDVGDCEYCQSDCWDTVPSAIAPTTPELRVVRVSWDAGGRPTLDASAVVWTGSATDEVQARVRRVEDLDGDGRLELVIAFERASSWPAGDGGDQERSTLYVDADTLALQLALVQSLESEGHGGLSSTARTEVTFRDRDGDGIGDFGIHYVATVQSSSCVIAEEDGSELPEECRGTDARVVATYSAAHDAWRLPEGQRWPW